LVKNTVSITVDREVRWIRCKVEERVFDSRSHAVTQLMKNEKTSRSLHKARALKKNEKLSLKNVAVSKKWIERSGCASFSLPDAFQDCWRRRFLRVFFRVDVVVVSLKVRHVQSLSLPHELYGVAYEDAHKPSFGG